VLARRLPPHSPADERDSSPRRACGGRGKPDLPPRRRDPRAAPGSWPSHRWPRRQRPWPRQAACA
jgi:hypothetical protein